MTVTTPCPCGLPDCVERPSDDTPAAIEYIATYCKEAWQPGEIAWFEYHCWESPDSGDAEIWYRSHQQVTILHEGDHDGWSGSSFIQRGHAGTPKTYRVRWLDGYEDDVFEDELLTDAAAFARPDPKRTTA